MDKANEQAFAEDKKHPIKAKRGIQRNNKRNNLTAKEAKQVYRFARNDHRETGTLAVYWRGYHGITFGESNLTVNIFKMLKHMYFSLAILLFGIYPREILAHVHKPA